MYCTSNLFIYFNWNCSINCAFLSNVTIETHPLKYIYMYAHICLHIIGWWSPVVWINLFEGWLIFWHHNDCKSLWRMTGDRWSAQCSTLIGVSVQMLFCVLIDHYTIYCAAKLCNTCYISSKPRYSNIRCYKTFQGSRSLRYALLTFVLYMFKSLWLSFPSKSLFVNSLGERTFGVLTKLDLMDKGTNALDVSFQSLFSSLIFVLFLVKLLMDQ